MRMKDFYLAAATWFAMSASLAQGASGSAAAEACLPGEDSAAACQLSKSLQRKGPVTLSFDKNEESELPLSLANASRKTLDTTTPVKHAAKRHALDVPVDDWCKTFNR